MSDRSRRSAEEREAARLERERRRAQRSGGGLAPGPVARPRELARPEPSPPESERPELTQTEPERLELTQTEPEPAEIDQPEPDLAELPVHDVEYENGYDAEHENGYDAEHENGYDAEHDYAFEKQHEAPAGIRSVPRAQRLQGSNAPARRKPKRPTKRPRRKISHIGRVISLLALLLAGVAIWFLYELFQPFHGSGHGSVRVTIPAHAGAGQIGDLLEHDGVISSSFFFGLRATLGGERSDLRSGTYHLKLGMSYGDVLKALTTAPKAAKVSELTIIEGRSRPQIDALLRSQHVHGSYLSATRHSRLLDPRTYQAPRSTGSLEGFLFPSTYQLRDPITINALVADQLQTFRKQFASVNLSYARSKHLTPYDVLIIASMVQAEAETAHDRPRVASVIYNRLRDSMPLQIDATTRFATGNYAKPLTVSQLNSSSRYNTRIHQGLPPGPIDNPGMASIQAAAHPTSTRYLYFVVKPCGNGEHVFSSSYSQFLKDAARYQTARTQRGGKSPEKC